MTACIYSDATTCSGHGAAQSDGSCVCSAGFWGAECSGTCDPDFCDGACNRRGALQDDGECECSPGWLPSGQHRSIAEHANLYCGQDISRASLDATKHDLDACKLACAMDKDCIYVSWGGVQCLFSSECSSSREVVADGKHFAYVSFCPQ